MIDRDDTKKMIGEQACSATSQMMGGQYYGPDRRETVEKRVRELSLFRENVELKVQLRDRDMQLDSLLAKLAEIEGK